MAKMISAAARAKIAASMRAKCSPEAVFAIRAMRVDGMAWDAISDRLGYSERVVKRWAADAGISTAPVPRRRRW